MNAVGHDGKTCIRCKENFFQGREDRTRCAHCGVHIDRIVRVMRRKARIGGKRGRNSGTTNTAKNK